MRVALLYPIVAALVEKLATVFPDGLTVVGPPPDDLYNWDPRILPLAKLSNRMAEWRDVGLKVDLIEAPYAECDFGQFDCLIESVETFHYSADWRNHCERVECPIITKVCWVNNPADLPPGYAARMRRFPLLLEMPSHYDVWKATAFEDVSLVLEPVGDWWFDRPWTGAREEVLFTLAGRGLWRPGDDTVCGLDIWDRLVQRFPGRTHHQDGAQDFKTAREMTQLYSESRCYVNLDRGDARPLSVAFIEALCAGMPVAARDFPGISYGKFIDGNGVCTNDFERLCDWIDRCFTDPAYARRASDRSREIGRANFSVEVLRPQYLAAIERARAVFASGRGL